SWPDSTVRGRGHLGAVAALVFPAAGSAILFAPWLVAQGPAVGTAAFAAMDGSGAAEAGIGADACEQCGMGFHGTQLPRLVAGQHEPARARIPRNLPRNHRPNHWGDAAAGRASWNVFFPDALCQGAALRGAAGAQSFFGWRNRSDAGQPPPGRGEAGIQN